MPIAVFGAFVGLYLRRYDLDVYAQVGLIMLIGLSAKNAILIIQFALGQMAHGVELIPATLEGVRLRLRPILMTSFAFILGVVPLMVAKGAGAEMRVALGTAVFSGMLGVTIFGIFFTPVFYSVIRWFTGSETAGPVPKSSHDLVAQTADGPVVAAGTANKHAE